MSACPDGVAQEHVVLSERALGQQEACVVGEVVVTAQRVKLIGDHGLVGDDAIGGLGEACLTKGDALMGEDERHDRPSGQIKLLDLASEGPDAVALPVDDLRVDRDQLLTRLHDVRADDARGDDLRDDIGVLVDGDLGVVGRRGVGQDDREGRLSIWGDGSLGVIVEQVVLQLDGPILTADVALGLLGLFAAVKA